MNTIGRIALFTTLLAGSINAQAEEKDRFYINLNAGHSFGNSMNSYFEKEIKEGTLRDNNSYLYLKATIAKYKKSMKSIPHKQR